MRIYSARNFLSISIIISAIIFRAGGEGVANLSYMIIAAYALFGPSQAIQALTLSWLFSMINPALVPDASIASIGRYAVILAAGVSVALRIKFSNGELRIKKLSLLTLCLGLFMLIHSIFFSVVVDVSVLKVVSWLMVLLTLLSAWQGLATEQREALFDQLQWLLILLVLVSLPLLAVPNVGYLVNGTGFQGTLNHPQSFGPTVALLGVLLGGQVLGSSKPAWRDILLFGLCLIMVVLSEARTAGFAMVLGLLSSVLLSPVFAGVSRRRMLPGLRSRRFHAITLIALVGSVALGPLLVSEVSSFIFKRSDAASLFDAADASRGALVDDMLKNIQESPWTGIGFGIASVPENMEVVRDPLLGLPISAQVEKGVMPVAVVEELGIVGAFAVLSWFLVVLRLVARSGVQRFSVVVTLVLVNFGESMFFSVGGMGMLLLILLTGAVTGEQRVGGKSAHV